MALVRDKGGKGLASSLLSFHASKSTNCVNINQLDMTAKSWNSIAILLARRLDFLSASMLCFSEYAQLLAIYYVQYTKAKFVCINCYMQLNGCYKFEIEQVPLLCCLTNTFISNL